MKPDILIASGEYFDFTRPEEARFDIVDIAHALSNICRFTGHTRRFYSVAQHSVLVSQVVDQRWALEGLLHDAAEAFIGDVSRPLKAMLPDYKAIEQRVEAAVLGRFGLAPELPPAVKAADLVLLATEKRDLMPAHEATWSDLQGFEPMAETIVPVSSELARRMFVERYKELHSRRLERKLDQTPRTIHQQVTVRYSSGAYNTNRIGGHSASSTSSARFAVERLASKLFDDAWHTSCALNAASSSSCAPEVWTITATAKASAGSPA